MYPWNIRVRTKKGSYFEIRSILISKWYCWRSYFSKLWRVMRFSSLMYYNFSNSKYLRTEPILILLSRRSSSCSNLPVSGSWEISSPLIVSRATSSWSWRCLFLSSRSILNGPSVWALACSSVTRSMKGKLFSFKDSAPWSSSAISPSSLPLFGRGTSYPGLCPNHIPRYIIG